MAHDLPAHDDELHHDDAHHDGDGEGHCHSPEHGASTLGRRAFLRQAIGGVLGMTVAAPLIGLFAPRAAAPGLASLWADDPTVDPASLAGRAASARVRSVIVLWMDGGPSQLDTFDPKPGSRNGGEFKAIKTALPGLLLSQHLERVATIADKLCVVRSMTTGEGSHARAKHYLRTGYKPQGNVAFPGMGAMMAHELGDDGKAIPMNVAVNAPGFSAGFLGVRFDPFYVAEPGKPVENLALPPKVDAERMERRLALLRRQQDRFAMQLGDAAAEDVRSYDRISEAAHAFMNAPEARAFDITSETAATRDAYGDSRFGRGCLMARRLVEQGVRFIEVSLPGWDTHQDNFTRVARLLGDVDRGMHALITDLAARDLLDSTLILWMGEFGRTPAINANAGRDHYPRAWSVAMAGGGVRPGVLGATDNDGNAVVARPVKTEELFATVFTLAGVPINKTFHTPQGRPISVVNKATPLTEVLA